MDFLEGHEIEAFQALGDAVRVAAAVGALAAVDVERADAEGLPGGAVAAASLQLPSSAEPPAGPSGAGREACQRQAAQQRNGRQPQAQPRRHFIVLHSGSRHAAILRRGVRPG